MAKTLHRRIFILYFPKSHNMLSIVTHGIRKGA